MKVLLAVVCLILAGFTSSSLAAPLPAVPAEIESTHFVVTINGQQSPVLHAAMNLYFLNFEARRNATITVTADSDDFWAKGVEVQPWRLNIRPVRNGRSITFHLRGAEKISISRPTDFGSEAEMLYLFANPKELQPPAGARYFGPGVHRENIDAVSGDHIYLAPGAVVFGSLNLWQVDHVTVSGTGVIVYDGPQNPADDDGWMHKRNWHCIVMDQAHDISIQGITCVVRSRTWQIQMKDSRGIVFDNIKVIGANKANANADGMDWLGGGDTLVRDSFFRAADDVFALQSSWDGYGPEAFSHQGEPVTNITIERGVFSASISNIVRAGWPEKNFEGSNFTMRDADVIHMGLGGCGIPFALMELWADPNGRGVSSGFRFEDVRLEDWYSLTQLMQPVDGVSHISFQDVAALETPALVPSVLKGSISGVTLDNAGLNGTAFRGANGVEVLGGADQPSVLDGAPQVTVTVPTGLVKPGQRVRFEAVAQAPGLRFHWLFGDGKDAYGARVKHRFPDAEGTLHDGSGRFRVLLEATSPAGRHSWVSTPVVVAEALRPALADSGSVPGMTYTFAPTEADGEPITGVAETLSLREVPENASHYTLSLDGLLNVPADGGYIFLVTANADASLELDGRTIGVSRAPIEQVCGLAGMAAQYVRVSVALQRGKHRLRIVESHGLGRDDFRILWQGPNFALSPIPAEALSH
jgi:hypothetical protein